MMKFLTGGLPELAAALPVASACRALTASAMRSWWASALTGRPMTRSTTSMAISPKRFDASSTARWRARATSASAPPTMRSNSAWPRVWKSTRTASAVRLACATISRACLACLFEHGTALVVGRRGVGARLVGRVERGADPLLSFRHARGDRRDDLLPA